MHECAPFLGAHGRFIARPLGHPPPDFPQIVCPFPAVLPDIRDSWVFIDGTPITQAVNVSQPPYAPAIVTPINVPWAPASPSGDDFNQDCGALDASPTAVSVNALRLQQQHDSMDT